MSNRFLYSLNTNQHKNINDRSFITIGTFCLAVKPGNMGGSIAYKIIKYLRLNLKDVMLLLFGCLIYILGIWASDCLESEFFSHKPRSYGLKYLRGFHLQYLLLVFFSNFTTLCCHGTQHKAIYLQDRYILFVTLIS